MVETVSKIDKATILWDMQIHTDREIKAKYTRHNCQRSSRESFLLGVLIPTNDNISMNETGQR